MVHTSVLYKETALKTSVLIEIFLGEVADNASKSDKLHANGVLVEVRSKSRKRT